MVEISIYTIRTMTKKGWRLTESVMLSVSNSLETEAGHRKPDLLASEARIARPSDVSHYNDEYLRARGMAAPRVMFRLTQVQLLLERELRSLSTKKSRVTVTHEMI
ncbi:uncharacterized protein LOC116429536 [Nomia melanderi]|uniref:uncharacterized protein LOC116429536 n=1 Tax=Nomia melanderi TaxID=2448451 RepID=UPI003FCE577E